MSGPPPAPPRIDFSQSQPLRDEDVEFFGLPEDGDASFLDESDAQSLGGPLSRLSAGVLAPVRKLGTRVRQRDDEHDFEDLATLSDAMRSPSDDVDPEIAQHMVKLRDHRNLDEFFALAAQTSLFETYERELAVRQRQNVWSVRIALLVMVIVGAFFGPDYVNHLLNTATTSVPAIWLVQQLGWTAARGVWFGAGLTAPFLVFVVSSVSVEQLIAGSRDNSPARAVLGAAGCVISALALLLLGSYQYPAAVFLLVGAWAAVRIASEFMRGRGL